MLFTAETKSQANWTARWRHRQNLKLLIESLTSVFYEHQLRKTKFELKIYPGSSFWHSFRHFDLSLFRLVAVMVCCRFSLLQFEFVAVFVVAVLFVMLSAGRRFENTPSARITSKPQDLEGKQLQLTTIAWRQLSSDTNHILLLMF